MKMKYDVIIIGAGPAGLFSAYELIEKNPNLKIAILDKGAKAKKRNCPMQLAKTNCKNCNPCRILSGYGGAGTFSDGKLNFIPKLGKSDLFKYMNESEAYQLIEDTEQIFTKFKMDGDVFPSNIEEAEKIKRKVAIQGARLLLIKQKHLGSDYLPEYIDSFSNYLEEKGVTLLENADVTDILPRKNNFYEIVYNNQEKMKGKRIIVAPGRTGAKWVQQLAEKYKIPYSYGTLAKEIINRDGTDMCPMEKTVLNIDDLDEAYVALDRKVKELMQA